MSITLGSNLSSMRAQNQLSGLHNSLSTVYERLSSGQRINRAADDAAGLAVSMQLTNRERVLGRAIMNVSDATSLVSTANSALDQVSYLAERMAELANQAANGALSQSQRRTLDKEFKSLSAEISRITDSTTFNSKKLFEGQRSTPTPEIVASATPFTRSATSATGRFTATQGASSLLYDSQSGEVVEFHSGSITAGSLQVLDNGDVFFRDQGDFQLKRYNYSTGTLETLAAGSGFDVSADGNTIAFLSTTQYADGGTVDSDSGFGPNRLYLMDLTTGIIRVSPTTDSVFSGTLKLSEDGSRVAFLGEIDSFGSGNNYLYTATFGENGVSTLERVPDLPALAFSLLHGIDNDGRVIYSRLDDSDLPVQQLFAANTAGVETQLTNFTASLNFSNIAFTVDSRLSQAHFISNANITGDNDAGASQVFRLDMLTGDLSQVTDYTSSVFGVSSTSISADGRILRDRSGASIREALIVTDSQNVNFEVGQGAKGTISTELAEIRSIFSGLGAMVISSQSSAGVALDVLKENREAIANLQGKFGATLSRLQTASSLLSSQRNEIAGANSRIMDADVASEVAQLVRFNIQQESITAVLAQANQQPALALQLLDI